MNVLEHPKHTRSTSLRTPAELVHAGMRERTNSLPASLQTRSDEGPPNSLASADSLRLSPKLSNETSLSQVHYLISRVSNVHYIGRGKDASVFAYDDDHVLRVANNGPHNWLDNSPSIQSVKISTLPKNVAIAVQVVRTDRDMRATTHPVNDPNNITEHTFYNASILPKLAGKGLSADYNAALRLLLESTRLNNMREQMSRIHAVNSTSRRMRSIKNVYSRSEWDQSKLQSQLDHHMATEKAYEDAVSTLGKSFIRNALIANAPIRITSGDMRLLKDNEPRAFVFAARPSEHPFDNGVTPKQQSEAQTLIHNILHPSVASRAKRILRVDKTNKV